MHVSHRTLSAGLGQCVESCLAVMLFASGRLFGNCEQVKSDGTSRMPVVQSS